MILLLLFYAFKLIMGKQKIKEEFKCDQKENVDPADTERWCGIRHVQMFLLFILFVISFGMKVNLSIGIVAMTDPSANSRFPTFVWTTQEKNLLLSSLFWGYVIPQIAAGQLAGRYGSKWILTCAMMSCALFTALIPKMAEHGIWACIICRALQGLAQGYFHPCVHDMLSKWIPQNERSRMGTFVYSGCQIGIILSMLLTGKLATSPLGWPSAFYLYATFGLVWAIVWSWLGASSPMDYKTISEREKQYIISSDGYSISTEHIPTPWRSIFTSLPLWGLLVANCGQLWCYWTLMNEMPTYLNTVLDFDISIDGLLSAIPYLINWCLGFPFAYLTDFLINKKILSTGTARKFASTVGLFGPAIALIVLGSERDTTSTSAVILLTIAVGVNSAVLSGIQINHIDISPTHASTLMGITQTAGNICGIIAPIVVDKIVTDEYDPEQWDLVFLLAAGIYLISCLFFIVFGSGKIQQWGRPKTLRVSGSLDRPANGDNSM